MFELTDFRIACLFKKYQATLTVPCSLIHCRELLTASEILGLERSIFFLSLSRWHPPESNCNKSLGKLRPEQRNGSLQQHNAQTL